MAKFIPEVPMNMDWNSVREFLSSMRETVVGMQSTTVPPEDVTNLRVTPLPGGNKVQWTMSGAEAYVVLISDSQSWDASAGRYIDAGTSSEYNDHIGVGAITYYYWVKARNGNQYSKGIGPIAGTSLALNVAATLPANIPASSVRVSSNETGKTVPARPTKGRLERLA